MALTHSIKYKAEQIIKKIENDDFDNSDIDTLLILLRDSSKGFDRFIEMAHFIAHPERIKGLLFERAESYYLTTKFMAYSQNNNGNINLTEFAPSFIKDYLLDKVKRCNDSYLRNDLKYNRVTLNEEINQFFKDYVSLTRLEINESHPSYKKFDFAIRKLLGVIDFTAVFTTKDLINDFIEIFKKNNLYFDESKLKLKQEKIIISILVLLHNAIFKTKYGSVDMIVSGGTVKTLVVACKVPIFVLGKNITMLLTVLDSEISSSKWCSPSFFLNAQQKSIIKIDKNFKLERILIVEKKSLRFENSESKNIRLMNTHPCFVWS